MIPKNDSRLDSLMFRSKCAKYMCFSATLNLPNAPRLEIPSSCTASYIRKQSVAYIGSPQYIQNCFSSMFSTSTSRCSHVGHLNNFILFFSPFSLYEESQNNVSLSEYSNSPLLEITLAKKSSNANLKLSLALACPL